jgi:hypothetical protein
MKLAPALTGALFVASAAPAQTPHTFGMSFDQFRRTLDQHISADTASHLPRDAFTTKSCLRRADRYECTFNETGFQSAVNEWRKLGLIIGSGRFSYRLRLSADTIGNRVNRIVVTSVRDDMINLLVGHLSTVIAAMRVFEPGAADGEGEPKRTVDRLGLMRGDANPTIGKPMSMPITGAMVTCTNWDTRITSKVECVFTPR